MNEVTQVLSAIEQGAPDAAERLLPLVYEELRKLAARRMAHEKPGQTIQPTALVHEAYLRLIQAGGSPNWNGSAHFFAAAAEAMRRILLDRARARNRLKRGGDRKRVQLELASLPDDLPDEDLVNLDEALDLLEAEDPTTARLVKLRFFAGLGQDEAARILGMPRRTADRHWAFARAWLYDRLRPRD